MSTKSWWGYFFFLSLISGRREEKQTSSSRRFFFLAGLIVKGRLRLMFQHTRQGQSHWRGGGPKLNFWHVKFWQILKNRWGKTPKPRNPFPLPVGNPRSAPARFRNQSQRSTVLTSLSFGLVLGKTHWLTSTSLYYECLVKGINNTIWREVGDNSSW